MKEPDKVTETKYLIFKEFQFVGRKTKWISITNYKDEFLGQIKWKTGWRRYIWMQDISCEIELDSNCMKEITKYIDNLMKARKCLNLAEGEKK